MDRDIAKFVSEEMLYVGGRLNEMLWRVKNEAGEGEEFVRIRRAVGEIMGVMLDEVMNPIYGRYPELEPPELSGKG